ncbi:MAG: glycosyltransferase [Enterococcus avium]|uniref:glycosyltransferase n=1 Tax=Enterococcus avium TaxID=33945 RepID=UPI002890C685|nr:glycosyltransferase [Enterococcus avium]MDT2463500.1 glycosyltransferase [Enterococcus avium]
MEIKMKIACGIVLFFPNDLEISRIESKLSEFSMVVVFDNSEYGKREKYIELQNEFKQKEVDYYYEMTNVGLSKAYNTMCKLAYDAGCDFLLLLDQDSNFSNSNIRNMVRFIAGFEEKEKIGIFAPTIRYDHKDISPTTQENEYTYVDWAISSGSFINLDIYMKTPGFDNFLFIDRVDDDYSRMLIKNGYKIVRNNHLFLEQELGETIVRGKKKVTEHSSLRHYYMSRNRLYIYRKYDSYLEFLIKGFFRTLRQITQILLYQTDKKNKLISVFRGIKDFIVERRERTNIT